ncbi:hypothetical protein J4714_13220 [Staphylococcus epidermidis]|nr:hypothetical protein [Staphylococcus epidermidis]
MVTGAAPIYARFLPGRGRWCLPLFGKLQQRGNAVIGGATAPLAANSKEPSPIPARIASWLQILNPAGQIGHQLMLDVGAEFLGFILIKSIYRFTGTHPRCRVPRHIRRRWKEGR